MSFVGSKMLMRLVELADKHAPDFGLGLDWSIPPVVSTRHGCLKIVVRMTLGWIDSVLNFVEG